MQYSKLEISRGWGSWKMMQSLKPQSWKPKDNGKRGFGLWPSRKYRGRSTAARNKHITTETRKRAIRDCRPLPGLVLWGVCVVLCGVFCVAFVYWCVMLLIRDITRTATSSLLAVMTGYQDVPLWCNPALIGHLTLTLDVYYYSIEFKMGWK